MQVQDFTVIRISPIVYNDRDILEIGVISHSPQTGHTNAHTHTRFSNSRSCMFLQTCSDRRTRTHTDTLRTKRVRQYSPQCIMQSCCAMLHGIVKNNKRLQHRFAVLLFTGPVCLLSHIASCDVLCADTSGKLLLFFLGFFVHLIWQSYCSNRMKSHHFINLCTIQFMCNNVWFQ